MITADQFNATLEAAGAAFILLNCRRLYIDRQARGISVWAVVFFTLWGLWNVGYYASLHQDYSAAACVCVSLCNALWLLLWARYRHARRAVNAWRKGPGRTVADAWAEEHPQYNGLDMPADTGDLHRIRFHEGDRVWCATCRHHHKRDQHTKPGPIVPQATPETRSQKNVPHRTIYSSQGHKP